MFGYRSDGRKLRDISPFYSASNEDKEWLTGLLYLWYAYKRNW